MTPLTEGYNPTPNFFIRAFVDEKLDSVNHGLKVLAGNQSYKNIHFPNRLFDRDTLLIQMYAINFLYVLSAYVSVSEQERTQFKHTARQKFRQEMVEFLKSEFDFFKITPHGMSIKEFISQNFRSWTGRMYCPSDFERENAILIANAKSEEAVMNWENTRVQIWFPE